MKILLSLIFFISFLFASVDINKAAKEELIILHGIGVKKAQKIVDYRDKNGCFKTVDDLIKVKGIGKKTVDKNREEITLSKCK